MPRSGPGVYTLPATYEAVDGELATAQQHNDPLEDLESDANTPRPVVAGGTGASTAPTALTALGAVAMSRPAQGRLTLETGVAVSTTDQTGKGTLYYTPYVGNSIALYNGTAWVNRTFTELSVSIVATSGKPYDVFVYDNGGTATLETLVWTNDTTRATALVRQDGVLCKSGALTRRYVGTFYASATDQCEDSNAKRYLWNMYNRVHRIMRIVDTTDNWNYTTATYRQARASTANQLDFVRGLNEDAVRAEVIAHFSNTSVNVPCFAPIGLDSTTSPDSYANGLFRFAGSSANTVISTGGYFMGMPSAGRHTLVWLEFSTATGTTTWYGDSAGTLQSGMVGEIMA